jgi:hypothetical protein
LKLANVLVVERDVVLRTAAEVDPVVVDDLDAGLAACFSTAAPDVASIESMMRTLTPSPIMPWAICWNRAVLPPAF